jgi:hypothetical protein
VRSDPKISTFTVMVGNHQGLSGQLRGELKNAGFGVFGAVSRGMLAVQTTQRTLPSPLAVEESIFDEGQPIAL